MLDEIVEHVRIAKDFQIRDVQVEYSDRPIGGNYDVITLKLFVTKGSLRTAAIVVKIIDELKYELSSRVRKMLMEEVIPSLLENAEEEMELLDEVREHAKAESLG